MHWNGSLPWTFWNFWTFDDVIEACELWKPFWPGLGRLCDWFNKTLSELEGFLGFCLYKRSKCCANIRWLWTFVSCNLFLIQTNLFFKKNLLLGTRRSPDLPHLINTKSIQFHPFSWIIKCLWFSYTIFCNSLFFNRGRLPFYSTTKKRINHKITLTRINSSSRSLWKLTLNIEV